ncbi:MAG: Ig-like domain-containing protein [Pseudomonadota bacterium]
MRIENLLKISTRFGAGLIVFFTLLLAGCSGGKDGGGGTGPVSSTLSFPLQSGMKASVQQGYSANFTVSGTCSGTSSLNISIPLPATFENVAGLSVVSAANLNLTNCSPPFLYATSADYYDSNYDQLGTINSIGDYGVYATPPAIPVSVKVGDTGMIGTINYYSDSTKTFPTGHDDISYVIEPDTANTAIVNMIDKSYDLNGNLTSTQQDRYRINANGTLIPVSADIQLAYGSTTHFVLSALPDTVPPAILSTSPLNYSTTIPAYTTVTATFSEAIDPATVNAGSFTLMAGTTPVSGSVTYSGHTATFTPSAFLTPSTVYRAAITTAVTDLAGNAMSSNSSWQFQTSAPDTTPPTVTATTPVNSASAIAVNSATTATFSEAIDPATVTAASFTLMNGSTPVSGTVAASGTAATFTPAASLTTNTLYTATITTGVKDLAGNALSTNYSWSFQTFSPVTPTVSSVSPVPYAYAVPLNSAITATFSTSMDPTSVTGTTFILMGGTTPVSGSVTYSGATATFTPSAPLTTNTVYRATITNGVKDLAGTAMSTNYSWTFQTFADGSSTGPVNPPPAGLWQPASGSTPANGNFVYLQSDVGDYIGGGQTHTYTPATATLSVSATGGHLSVGVNGNTWWNGNFQTMNTLSQLQPGFYPGLQRYPFNNPVLGGLDWSGDGRGCNTEKGWFAVDSVTYVNGTLTAIDLRFEQNCEGGTTALHGAIHWGP